MTRSGYIAIHIETDNGILVPVVIDLEDDTAIREATAYFSSVYGSEKVITAGGNSAYSAGTTSETPTWKEYKKEIVAHTGWVEPPKVVKAYYFSPPELEEAIQEKGIASHHYLLSGHADKPHWVKQHEKEEKELDAEGLAPIHAYIIPPQFIGTDIGKRIFSELIKRYGSCVKSFDLQVDKAVYLINDPDNDAMDRAVAGQDLLRVLAVSSAALQNAADESLFKWLVKALILTGPITDWQEVIRHSGRRKIPVYAILSVVYAAAVFVYGFFSDKLSFSWDDLGTGIITSIISLSFAFLAIAVLVDIWIKVSGRELKNFYLPIFFLLAFAVVWPCLLGLLDLQFYFLYAYGLLLIPAMIGWPFAFVWVLGRKVLGKNQPKVAQRTAAPITHELQEKNEREAEVRGWWTSQQLLENRPGAPEDTNEGWSVCLSGPGLNRDPFSDRDSALGFLRCIVRDSIEQLRKPDQTPDELFELWFALGETGALVGDEYSVLHEIDTFINQPASESERDWRAIVRDAEYPGSDKAELKGNSEILMDISRGIQLEEPDVFIPWEITEKTLVRLLGQHGLQGSRERYTLPCVLLGGMKQKLGFMFGKDGRGGGQEGRGLWQLFFAGEQSGTFVENYLAFQKQLEQAFGSPEPTKDYDPDVFNLPSYRWSFRHVYIGHWVMERFGPEEHRDFYKTYITKDDSLLMETVNSFFSDESLSDQPIFTFVTGVPCSGKTTLIRKEFSKTNVWLDAGEIFLKLNRRSWSAFGKIMKYPMNHIGRRVLKRAFQEQRNIVMEVWPEEIKTMKLILGFIEKYGFQINVYDLDCKLETAQERNKLREQNNISSYYSSSFHMNWLVNEIDK